MKRPTKKTIQTVLRTMDITAIHHVAHKFGINPKHHGDVFDFIKTFSPSMKVRRMAYGLSYGRSWNRRNELKALNMPIIDTIRFAKQQVKEGYTNYTKILIEGNNNIYWTSPTHGHSDYNKSIAMPNNEKNRKVMEVVNKYLGKHFKLKNHA